MFFETIGTRENHVVDQVQRPAGELRVLRFLRVDPNDEPAEDVGAG